MKVKNRKIINFVLAVILAMGVFSLAVGCSSNDAWWEENTTTINSHISSEKVRLLPAGLTYREIVERLGRASNLDFFCKRQHLHYIVDEEHFLIFRFNDLDRINPLSGEEMLLTMVSAGNNLHDFEYFQRRLVIFLGHHQGHKRNCWHSGQPVLISNFSYFGAFTISNVNIKLYDGETANIEDLQFGQVMILYSESPIFVVQNLLNPRPPPIVNVEKEDLKYG